MARDLALTSMAHTPKMTGATGCEGPISWKASCDPIEEGEEERVISELERGDGRSEDEVKKFEIRDWRSQVGILHNDPQKKLRYP